MSSRIGGHIRRNVIGYLALLVALSGTAYAANKVGTKDIRTGAVKSKQIGDDQVKSKDIKDGKGVKSRDVKDDGLTSSDIDQSTFPLRLNLPPTSWVTAGVPDADVTYFIGQARVEQGGGGSSFRNIFANVQAPNQIAGRSMVLKSFELCYGASATAVLNEVTVRTIESTQATPFRDTTVISDATSRTDTGCRTYEPAGPVVVGPNEFIEPGLSINFGGGGQFNVYRTTVVLEPS